MKTPPIGTRFWNIQRFCTRIRSGNPPRAGRDARVPSRNGRLVAFDRERGHPWPHFLCAAILLLAVSAGCSSDVHPDHSAETSEGLAPAEHFATIGGDFALTDQDGSEFELSRHQGKAAWLFFGYTFCPDICPLTLSRLALAHEELTPSRQDEVSVLFVSVDPKRDTPARLREYLTHFKLPVTGLTGTLEEIEEVTAKYGTSFDLSPTTTNAGYLVDHSSYIFLLDRQGRIRHLFKQSDPPQRIAALTAELLAMPPSS